MGFQDLKVDESHVTETDSRQRFATFQVRKMIENAAGMVGTGFFGFTADDAKERITGFDDKELPNGWQTANVSNRGKSTNWVGTSALRMACLAAVRDWRVQVINPRNGQKYWKPQSHKGETGNNGSKAKSRMRFLGIVDGFQHVEQPMLITSGTTASLSMAFESVYRQFVSDINKATVAVTGKKMPIYLFWMPINLDDKLTPPPGNQGQDMQLPVVGWDRTAIESNSKDGMEALLENLFVGDELATRLQVQWQEAQDWKEDQEKATEKPHDGQNGAGDSEENDDLPFGANDAAATQQLSGTERAVYNNPASFVGAVVSASGGKANAAQVQQIVDTTYGGAVSDEPNQRIQQFRAVLTMVAQQPVSANGSSVEEDGIPF